ncbi:MAG: PaaI family thioesterase [Methanoculleaceae archaeon]
MSVRAGHLNGHGTVHGGAIFTLADTAFGLASS